MAGKRCYYGNSEKEDSQYDHRWVCCNRVHLNHCFVHVVEVILSSQVSALEIYNFD